MKTTFTPLSDIRQPSSANCKTGIFTLLVSFIETYKYTYLQIVNLSELKKLIFYLVVTNIISNFVTQKLIINPNKKN